MIKKINLNNMYYVLLKIIKEKNLTQNNLINIIKFCIIIYYFYIIKEKKNKYLV